MDSHRRCLGRGHPRRHSGDRLGSISHRPARRWSAVAGIPYDIQLAADGCPIDPERTSTVAMTRRASSFRPVPSEVVLCTIPTEPRLSGLGSATPATCCESVSTTSSYASTRSARPQRKPGANGSGSTAAGGRMPRRRRQWASLCNGMQFSHTYSLRVALLGPAASSLDPGAAMWLGHVRCPYSHGPQSTAHRGGIPAPVLDEEQLASLSIPSFVEDRRLPEKCALECTNLRKTAISRQAGTPLRSTPGS